MSSILVNGLVSIKDKRPIIEINDVAKDYCIQMDAEDAVHLALNLLKMAEATKADALLVRWSEKFLKAKVGPEKTYLFGASLMEMFRDFRKELEDDSNKRQQK